MSSTAWSATPMPPGLADGFQPLAALLAGVVIWRDPRADRWRALAAWRAGGTGVRLGPLPALCVRGAGSEAVSVIGGSSCLGTRPGSGPGMVATAGRRSAGGGPGGSPGGVFVAWWWNWLSPDGVALERAVPH
ncbi:unnamed protein product [Ostreobium quekettii]|uniref:Uncharacterized protein n=1 Tax=Ostreobium quekettii TaxID=121088 RepID=A0A8S1IUG4_9CHLO|nr:unnamed protein product [Ostreobium quekettii]